MKKIKWIAPLFLALALVWQSYSPAAAQTPTPTPGGVCETVLFDWTEGDTSLQGWAYYTQEGTVQPLAVVTGALQGEQSGAGLTGYRASADTSYTVQSGDVIKITSDLAGGQISGGIGVALNDYDPGTTLPAGDRFTVVWDGTLNTYGTTTHSIGMNDWVGDEITSIFWWNRDSQTGSRTYRIYKIWVESPCTPTPTPTPGGGELCPLVPYGYFSDVGDWQLTGTASITDSVLSLASGDTAYQNLSFLDSNLTYNAVISVTSVVATADIELSLAFDTGSINVTETGEFSTTLQTGSLSGPILFTIENTPGSSPVEIDYVCLYVSDDQPNNENRVCIAPDNGEFDTATPGGFGLASGWFFSGGSSWNSQLKNVILPDDPPGQIRTTDSYSMPTLADGEYLIAGFDAVSEAETGMIGGAAQSDENNWSEFFGETYAEWYSYEFDISTLENSEIELRFMAPGVDPLTDTSIPGAVRVDNVCVFVSDQPPRLPYPTDPNAPPSVDFGNLPGCNDIDEILFGLVGVDLRAERETYANVPGFLDFSDWVPWLVSGFWVGIQANLCFFLVFLQTAVNFAEYLGNNWLNILTWVLASGLNFSIWLGKISFSFGYMVGNGLIVILATAENWLNWLSLIALVFGNLPVAIFPLLFVGLLWLFAGFIFGADFAENFFFWLLMEFFNISREDFLNPGITIWNLFIKLLGDVLGWLYDQFVVVFWNPIIAPYLTTLLGTFNPLVALGILIARLFSLFPTIWDFVFSVVMWLWENVFQIISLPITFYTGMQAGINSNAFGSLLDCAGGDSFWCAFLAGLDLINTIAGASIFYPIVIVAVILGTFMVLRKHGAAGWEIIIKSLENF